MAIIFQKGWHVVWQHFESLSAQVLRVLFFAELMTQLFLATYHIVGLGYVIRLSQLQENMKQLKKQAVSLCEIKD